MINEEGIKKDWETVAWALRGGTRLLTAAGVGHILSPQCHREVEMAKAKAVKVRISGQVQGVFFRVWTKGKADDLGVMGWIRNRLDGEVEGLFVGPGIAVDDLIEICWQGPSGALVDDIRIEDARGITPVGFVIKPTV